MSISINEPIDVGEGIIQKRPQKDFFVYERINGGEWRFRAYKKTIDAGSACDQWYASLRMRAREAVHFAGVTLVPPEHGRRKPVGALVMRDRLCYLFIGYGPGCLPFHVSRRHQRPSPAVSEWFAL